MTEEQIREEIARKLFKIQYPGLGWGISGTCDDSSWRRFESKCLLEAEQILSIKGIRIEAENQELPEIPFNYEDECREFTSYSKGQQDMLKDGWVKCKEHNID
jgi:hypothetical protein